jgi:hypothetical protein
VRPILAITYIERQLFLQFPNVEFHEDTFTSALVQYGGLDRRTEFVIGAKQRFERALKFGGKHEAEDLTSQ